MLSPLRHELTGVHLLEDLVDVGAVGLYTAGRALLLAILLRRGSGLGDLGGLLSNDGCLGHFECFACVCKKLRIEKKGFSRCVFVS